MFFLILGAAMFPSGFLAMRENSQIDKMDEEIAVFIRSLGKVTSTLGTTVSRSLGKIDRRSLRTLEPYIKRLDIRLTSATESGANPQGEPAADNGSQGGGGAGAGQTSGARSRIGLP